MALEKSFDPSKMEADCYQRWENSGCFAPIGTGTPYCIMIPPPNVTGSLHMGHAFQQTLMDILIRYHRMKGQNTLWQVGTDHAGIATQMVVERKLLADGITRLDIGREAFVQKIWEWKTESGGNITRQLRRMGASVDWATERFTLDEGLCKAVTTVFMQLHEEGLIYRKKRLVNWDPVLKTAVSDLEVESEEETGSLWYIRYPLADHSGELVVATTRPETMLGDVAVAVNPEDPRYISYIGKQIQLPLSNRLIPVIADESVDPAFGTGCVKITPAHDFNDYAMAERHNLPMINIFTLEAALICDDVVPKTYQNLDRFAARKKIIADLTANNLMVKIEPHKLQIPKGDRSGAILEPLLTDQWYVKVESLAKPAIAAVEQGKIRFIPDNWSKTYFEWMHNIQDWCISRQLWWGHRIPAWYDDKGNVYVAEDEAAVRKKHQLSADLPLKQDEDVLDTWFSSALWPFSTLGWPDQTERLKTFYPTQFLMKGFDIIFFCVARMIMFGLKFAGDIPFQEIYIHGLIQDQDGQKMSKTKGNVLDPIDLIDGIELEVLVKKRTSGLMQPQLATEIEKQTRKQYPKGIPAFGTDALRFTYASLATTGRHIRFDLARIEGYRHFCNKLWNAARYVLMNTEGKIENINAEKTFTTSDQWILSLWQKTKQSVAKHIQEYRFDLASQALYEFTWNEYCDWYLELSKPALNAENADPKALLGTRYTLITILEELLRATHPFMPYITEVIWQQVKSLAQKTGDTIMLQPYPEYDATQVNTIAEQDIEWIRAVVLGIRNIRGEMNISPSKQLGEAFYLDNEKAAFIQNDEKFKNHLYLLQFMTKVSDFKKLNTSEQRPAAATALVGNLEILIPLADLIDKEAEIARLQKEIDKATIELEKVKAKLSQESFISKAPENIVKQEKERLNELSSSIDKMNKQQMSFNQLSEPKTFKHPFDKLPTTFKVPLETELNSKIETKKDSQLKKSDDKLTKKQ